MPANSSSHTLKHQSHNFVDWHKGISHYGFWCIEVTNPVWFRAFDTLQQQLSAKLTPNYQRQPHITLHASGLLDEQHFSECTLHQQLLLLEKLNLKSFKLSLADLNSFTAGPYIAVSYNENLVKIRQTLNNVSSEDSPAQQYKPHITLGFYNEAYRLSDIQALIERIGFEENEEMEVNEIVFACYETKYTQARYKVLHRVELGD